MGVVYIESLKVTQAVYYILHIMSLLIQLLS